jgi:hypothetical protein
MIKIDLTPAEIQMASMVGCQRAIENIQNKDFRSRSGESQHDLFGRMINGALAEAALAKHLNKFWSKGVKGGADVDDVDVRCTHYHNGDLEMHTWDKDDRKYYLLTGMLGSYILRGWIWGKDAKKQEYWKVKQAGRDPQFWVPQSALNDNTLDPQEKHWLDD